MEQQTLCRHGNSNTLIDITFHPKKIIMNNPTKPDEDTGIPANEHKSWPSLIYTAVLALVTAIIIGTIALTCTHRHTTDENQQRDIKQSEMSCIEKEAEIAGARYAERALDKARLDSIEEANRPNYTEEELEKMVRRVVPSYSMIDLWKKDNHDWIMKYERIKHHRSVTYLRTFDPTDKKFGREMEVTQETRETNYGTTVTVYTPQKGSGWYEGNYYGALIYFDKNGKALKQYTNKNITSRLENTSSRPRFNVPDDDDDDDGLDGYEDVDDYYYDNAEDLYFYYNGDH